MFLHIILPTRVILQLDGVIERFDHLQHLFPWLAQPLPHGLFVGEILTKHAHHRMRQDAVILR